MIKEDNNLRFPYEGLKPCPLCGFEAKIIRQSYGHTRDSNSNIIADSWKIQCTGCGLETKSFIDAISRDDTGIYIDEDGIESAIYYWNHRWNNPDIDVGKDDK